MKWGGGVSWGVMIVAAWMALAQAALPEEPVGLEFLRYLARHQRPDGSWGERPETCRCPEESARRGTAPGAADVRRLIRDLGEEDPVRRDRATRELRGLADAVLPDLLDATRDLDPEIRERCAALRRELEPFARGGGDVELTGLALLAFLSAGYTHYSKDQDFGTVVKNGIRWLLGRQNELGVFDEHDPVADTIATLALVECFGHTKAAFYRDDALQAVERVAGRAMTEPRGLIWKGIVLKSAQLFQLPVSQEAARENLELLRGRPRDTLSVAGTALVSVYVDRRRDSQDFAGLDRLDPRGLNAETLYFSTVSTFQFDGPRGRLWSAWKPQSQRRLLAGRCARPEGCEKGSWSGIGYRGRLQATALNGMNFLVYAGR